MKKFLYLLVVFAFLLNITACSSSEKPSTPTTKESEEKEEVKELEIVDSGYSLSSKDSPYIKYGIEIKNPNSSYTVEFPNIRITAYDENENILASSDQTFNTIAPGETIHWGSQADCAEKIPSKVEFEITNLDEDYVESTAVSSNNALKITNKNVVSDGFDTKFTGKIKNDGALDVSTANISVILYKDGKIIFGTSTFVDNIASGKEIPFDVSEYSDIPEYDSYEIYALDWSF